MEQREASAIMIFETAMADAYAAAWEFVKPEDALTDDWSGYRQRPDGRGANRSLYTDDTLRTIANARVILAGQAGDALAYVREIKRVFREDKRGGWSSGFRAFLESHQDLPDDEWLGSLRPRNTNGALMGAAVMGVLPSAEAARAAGELQALITHDEEAARWAGVISLASFLVHQGAGPDTIIPRLERKVRTMSGFPHAGLMRTARSADARAVPVDMTAFRTCAHVIDVLSTQRTMRGIISEVIRRGGDTDSVAAAAVGIASRNPAAYENDLPDWMMTDLENGDPAAHALLRDLDARLDAFTRGDAPCLTI